MSVTGERATAAPSAPTLGRMGETPGGARPTRRRRGVRRWLVLGVAVLLAAGAAVGARVMPAAPAPTATPAPAPPALRARGTIQPIARANVATLTGGVVAQLPVQVGQSVDGQRPLARVALGGQTEVLVAPWPGTVTAVNVHLGDTAMPGTVVATIADLSAYRVETTDVDEYLVGRLRPGQPAAVTLDALDGAQLRGRVRTVSLQQQPSPTGGTNYPVVLDLAGSDADLRPGMTARVTFQER